MSTSVPTGNTYDKYRSKNPIERRLMKGFFAALSDVLPREHPATVLEVGVGEGEISAQLRSLYPECAHRGHRLARRIARRRVADAGVRRRVRRHRPPAVPTHGLRPRDGDRGARARRRSRGRAGRARARQPRPTDPVRAARAHLAGRQHGSRQVPGRPRQHPRPHPALVTPELRRARGVTARSGEREHPVPVDDDRGATARDPPQRQRSPHRPAAVPAMPARQA